MTKTKKRQKSTRMYGKHKGTHGGGCRKNRKGNGHHGGKGMAGTGKRADHKKTLMNNLYGNDYFGKQGVTSRGTEKDRRLRINLGQVENNLNKFIEKGIAKKTKDGYEINLSDYKILGDGEIKNKLVIKCFEASASATEKVEKAGGKIIAKEIKEIITPLIESPKLIERRKKEQKEGKKPEKK